MKFSLALAVLLVLGLSLLVPEAFARKVAQKRHVNSKSKSSSSDDDDHHSGKYWIELGKKTEAREKRSAIQKAVVEKLYQSIVWPTSAYLAQAIENGNYSVVSDLLTEDVQGRISPLGRFDTYVATGEYFFGLAGPLPGTSTAGKNRVVSVLFDKPILCTQNQCSWRMVATLKDFNTNLTISNYTHIGYANFNTKNQICAYEITFLGLSRKDAPESAAARNATMNSLCNGIVAACPVNTSLEQFPSFAASQ